MMLTDDGQIVLLTRSADRLQAVSTSLVMDMRVWRDAEGAMPEREVRGNLAY